MRQRTSDESAPHPEPGNEIIWAVRACLFRTCAESDIRHILADVAMPEATDLLFSFAWTVRQAMIGTNPHAGADWPDELLLLDVIALYQEKRSFEAMIMLRSLLPIHLALIARNSAERLAIALLNKGHRLAPPLRPDVQHAAFVTAS